jgi:branched-subunit amino acid aminotransferase/4-amino-4-deoxychorismate lyase
MQTYIFQEGTLTLQESYNRVLVADSFLVEDGKVRSLDLHIDRFIRGLELKVPELKESFDLFLRQAIALIPKTGRYFPKLEVQEAETPIFVFTLRDAPEQLGPATLWTYPYPDPRKDLSVKGPELSLGYELRTLAQAQGADESILLNEHNEISEGALSSLVWWRGDVLCAPGDEIPWLESVTRREIFQIAESMGIQTMWEHRRPEELIGLELWLLSSLQGIRVVKNWIGVSDQFAEGQHVSLFEKRLKLLESHLP